MTSVGLVKDSILEEKISENVLEDEILEDDEDEIREDILEYDDIEKAKQLIINEISELVKLMDCILNPEITTKQLIIDKINELAKLNNCILISKTYSILRQKLEWQCQYGHKWEKTYHHQIPTKEWCRVCAKNKRQDTLLTKITDFAESKNGKCISVICKKLSDIVKLSCEKNHIWEVTADIIIF